MAPVLLQVGKNALEYGKNFPYNADMPALPSNFLQQSPPRHATGDETRARLIVAATEVFIQDGFRAARVQDIARRAGVRLSAINYHFGSKEGLYRAVLGHHAKQALESRPLSSPDGERSLPERFGFAVEALVGRMLGNGVQTGLGQLMLRELMNPTDLLETLIEHFTLPQARQMLALLREVVGPRVPDEVLFRCLISILGQCVVFMPGRPMIERMAPGILQGESVNRRIARHVARFSWAGLMAVREAWAESGENENDATS